MPSFIGPYEMAIILWLIPTVIAAYVAKRRGRRALVGVLTGIILGWVGVVLLLLLPVAGEPQRR